MRPFYAILCAFSLCGLVTAVTRTEPSAEHIIIALGSTFVFGILAAKL